VIKPLTEKKILEEKVLCTVEQVKGLLSGVEVEKGGELKEDIFTEDMSCSTEKIPILEKENHVVKTADF